MAYRGTEIPVLDLSGGQASNRPTTQLALNQAIELDNVHSLPGGGISLRNGDTEVNATTLGSAVQGVAWYRKANGDTDLVVVAGTEIRKTDYVSGSPDGTMDDVTGGLTITSGQNNLWFGFTAQDDLYFWGGPEGTFDTPFTFDGTTSTTVSGSAPVGKTAFFHNNRIFVIDDTNIRHSTLTDITDFSGDGSGTAEIDANDGFKLMAAAPLNTDVVLLFKENSIHQYVTTEAPFPRFPLFKDTGAAGPGAVVVHEGIAYFITRDARMKATDGSRIIDFPEDMNDVWDTVNKDRLQYTQGFVYEAKDHKYIGWAVSTGTNTSNNLLILWDLAKKSWWRYSTGYKINAITTDVKENVLYGGHIDGKLYKKDVSTATTDASESDSQIVGLWRWGWQTNNTFQKTIHPQRIQTSTKGRTGGRLQVTYGFEFVEDTSVNYIDLKIPGLEWDTDSWDIANWGGATDVMKTTFVFGRGSAFQVAFTNAIDVDELTWDSDTVGNWDDENWAGGVVTEDFTLNGFTVSGKQASQAVFDAP